jgi:hypothetical protein
MLDPVVGLGIWCSSPIPAVGRNSEGTLFVGTVTTRPMLSSSNMLPGTELDSAVAAAWVIATSVHNTSTKATIKYQPPLIPVLFMGFSRSRLADS